MFIYEILPALDLAQYVHAKISIGMHRGVKFKISRIPLIGLETRLGWRTDRQFLRNPNLNEIIHFAVQNQCQTVLVNQYRQKENLHLWYWYRLNFFHYFPHLTYSQCWMAELSLRTFDHRDLSEYHSNNLKFHASFCHLSWSECPRAYCRLFVYLFICKTKLKTLTEWLFPVRRVVLQ